MSLKAIGTLTSILNGLNDTTGDISDALIILGEAMTGLSKKSILAAASVAGLSKDETILLLTSSGLSVEQDEVAAATIASGTAAEGASVGFTTLGTSIKAVATGLSTFLLTNPVGVLLLMISALYAAYKVWDHFNVSVEEARENLSNLKQEYSENESDLRSLNDELKTTVSRINELENKDTLTFTEEQELENLIKQNAELQRKIDLLELEQKIKAKEINDTFLQVMDKDLNNSNEKTRPNAWYYDPRDDNATVSEKKYIELQFKEYQKNLDEIATLEERYKDDLSNKSYQKAKQRLDDENDKIIDYLQQKSEEFEEAASDISYISNPTTEDEKKVNAWLDYIYDFQDKMAIALGGTNAKENTFNRLIYGSYSNVTKELKELGKQGKVTADSLQDDKYKDFINRLTELGFVSDNSSESLRLIALAFNDMLEAVDDANESIEDFGKDSDIELIIDISAETEGLNKVISAMNESKSATGMTAESVEELKSRYKDLKNANVYKLFENTTGGIHLNKEALQELEKEYEALTKSKYQDKLQELNKEYNDAEKKLSGLTRGTFEYNKTLLELDGLSNQINKVTLLAAEYDGLTSKYKKWQDSLSGSNDRDSYESVGRSFKDMKEIFDAGWFGDESLNKYLDLMLSASKRTGDTINDWNALQKTIGNTGRSLMDYFRFDEDDTLVTDGLFDFLDDVKKQFGDAFVSINEDGQYSFDFSGDKLQQVADYFGISLELLQMIEKALGDAGMAINMGDLSEPTVLETKVQSINEGLTKINETPVDININSDNLTDVDSNIETLQDTIKKFTNEDGSLKVGVDQSAYDNAVGLLGELVSQKVELEAPTLMSIHIDTSGAISDLENGISLFQQLQEAITNLSLGINTEDSLKKIQELSNEILNLDDDTKVSLKIDDQEVQSALSNITGVKLEPGVELNQEDIDALKGAIKKIDEEAIVELGLDSTIVDNYNPDKKGFVTYSYNKNVVDSWNFNKTATITYKSGFMQPFDANKLGSAKVNGTAFSQGNWSTKESGVALGGELGRRFLRPYIVIYKKNFI